MICRTPNGQFGASGGVVSWDTSQDFGSLPPVRALPIPPPDAMLKRWAQVGRQCQRIRRNKFES